MKIYKTQQEIEVDIKNGALDCNYKDVKFECDININEDIINAYNVTAKNINSKNIFVYGNIIANNINAKNIRVNNIIADNIIADEIIADDINSKNITADYISYHAFCCVYHSIKCKTFKARRDNSNEPICLDGELKIIPDKNGEVENAIKLLELKGIIKDGKIQNIE